MKKDHFYQLLKNPAEASSVDIKSLKSQLGNTKYFAAARVLLAKVQRERKSFDAHEEIEANGLWYPNLLVLDEDIEEQIEEVVSEPEVIEEQKQESKDITKDIIDILPKPGTLSEPFPSDPAESKSEPQTPEIKEEPKEREEPKAEEPSQPVSEQAKPIEVIEEKPQAQEETERARETSAVESETEEAASGEDIADEVMRRLEEMKKNRFSVSKHVDENQETASKKRSASKTNQGKTSVKSKSKATPTKTAKAKPTAAKQVSPDSKTQAANSKRVAAKKSSTRTAKTSAVKKTASNSGAKTKSTPAKTSSKPTSKTKSKPAKSSEKKKTLEESKPSKPTSKNKEAKLKGQRHLIQEFIANPPELSKEFKGEEGPNKDLAIDSTSENRLLVSESLAKILTRQGKKDKAKEVYEQLMLKYPKKKSYFAAQIKSLEG